MNDEENFNQEMPTRRHFFRFMKCGIGALIGTIIFVKLNQQSYIALGATVFLINAFTILGYTISVKNADNFYSDEEADDLAYYLGFILTICALASIFIMDALQAKPVSAKEQSDLIKHALFQFGIGLTATMIGLCARIYLNSAQQEHSNQTAQNPQKTFANVYRALSGEVRALKQEMQDFNKSLGQNLSDLAKNFNMSQKSMLDATKKCTDGLENSANKLKSFAENLQESFDGVAIALTNTKEKILKNLNDKSLSQSADEFSTLLDNLKGVTKDFAATEKSFVISFKNIENATGDVLSKLSSFANDSQSASNELTAMRANIKNGSDSLSLFSKEVSFLTNTLASSKSAFSSFAKKAKNFEDINLDATQGKRGFFRKWFR